MLVYNPDDEPIPYRFAGSPLKELPANKETDLPEAEARHLVATWGEFGVVAFNKPISKKDKDQLIEEAEGRYKQSTRKWAEDLLVEFHDKTRSKRELGIKIDPPQDVVTAKAWLKKHGFMEK